MSGNTPIQANGNTSTGQANMANASNVINTGAKKHVPNALPLTQSTSDGAAGKQQGAGSEALTKLMKDTGILPLADARSFDNKAKTQNVEQFKSLVIINTAKKDLTKVASTKNAIVSIFVGSGVKPNNANKKDDVAKSPIQQLQDLDTKKGFMDLLMEA